MKGHKRQRYASGSDFRRVEEIYTKSGRYSPRLLARRRERAERARKGICEI
jgi:hypothetical protein